MSGNNLAQINNRLMKTVAENKAQQTNAVTSLDGLLNIASRSDNVLYKTIDATIKNVEKNPSLDNINKSIEKLTSLQEDAILPETDTYFNVTKTQLNDFKDFTVKRNDAISSIDSSIQSLSGKDYEDVSTIQGIYEAINESFISQFFNSEQRKDAQTRLKNRIDEIDEKQDALNYAEFANKIVNATSYKDRIALIGEEATKSKNPQNTQFLYRIISDLEASAKAGQKVINKLDESNTINKKREFRKTSSRFYEQSKALTSRMLSTDSFSVEKEPLFSSQTSKSAASFSQLYGEDTDTKLATFNAKALLEDTISNLAMFVQRNVKNNDPKDYYEANESEINDITHPDNRMHVNMLMKKLKTKYKPDDDDSKDAFHVWESWLDLQINQINHLYDFGPLNFPEQFNDENGNPSFGDGILPNKVKKSTVSTNPVQLFYSNPNR